jgi:hypothetical protein
MKKFLKNISFFLVGLIAIFIFNIGVNYLIIKNSDIKLNTSEILIIGDSHPMRSVNPSLFKNAQNICQSAEPYVITYWKLKAVINEIKPDTVLIGFAPHNISDFNDLKFSDKKWSHEMFERSYLIQDFRSLPDISIDYNSYYTFLFKKFCLFPRMNHNYYIGGYTSSNKSNISNVNSTIKRHFCFNDKPSNVSQTSIIYLDSIINLCISNNIIPILINTPVHSTYKTKIPDNIQKQFIIEMKKWGNKGIKIINNNSTLCPDTYFFNSDHLNSFGSSYFTPILIQLIREE